MGFAFTCIGFEEYQSVTGAIAQLIEALHGHTGAGTPTKSVTEDTFPSQAAQQKLGKAFNIRESHDQILKDGAMPLDILDQKIRNWINSKLSSRLSNSKNNPLW